MRKTTALLGIVTALAAGAAASVYAVKKLVKKETGKTLEDILTENEEEDIQEAVSKEVEKILQQAEEKGPDTEIAAAVAQVSDTIEAIVSQPENAEAPAEAQSAEAAPVETQPAESEAAESEAAGE